MSWSGQSWGLDNHDYVADVTGDHRADIVGFGLDGVWVSLNNGDGTFQPPNMVLSAFSFHTGWVVEKHPRLLGDLTGDGRADIVGFGDAGVWTAAQQRRWHVPAGAVHDRQFRVQPGVDGWIEHPRFLVDLTGDGKADLVGFGNDGVWTALGNGDGSFQAPKLRC